MQRSTLVACYDKFLPILLTTLHEKTLRNAIDPALCPGSSIIIFG